MVEDRLNGLALLHIHSDVNVDRVKILDIFDTRNRRIGTLHLSITLLTFIGLCRYKHFKYGFKVSSVYYLIDL
jgi:hypothetical protein